MSPPPFTTTQFADDVYALLEPVAKWDEAQGWPLLAFVSALSEPFRQVEELVRARPGRDPWQQAFDIYTCPDWWVPWLGQWVGVEANSPLGADAQRQQVIAEGGFKRGRPATIIAAVQATLTGTQKVRLLERSLDAWTVSLFTDPAETPNPALTNKAAQDAKPAGLILTVSQRSVPIIDEGTRTIDSTPATIDAALLADVT